MNGLKEITLISKKIKLNRIRKYSFLLHLLKKKFNDFFEVLNWEIAYNKEHYSVKEM